jgi:hypothetical protein
MAFEVTFSSSQPYATLPNGTLTVRQQQNPVNDVKSPSKSAFHEYRAAERFATREAVTIRQVSFCLDRQQNLSYNGLNDAGHFDIVAGRRVSSQVYRSAKALPDVMVLEFTAGGVNFGIY